MMTKFFQSIFRILLLMIGILFFYMTIMMIWGLFQPLPEHEQLVSECSQMIQQGNYSNFSEANKLNACLDDSYRALGAAPLGIIFIPIFILISWLGLRYGLRIFKK